MKLWNWIYLNILSHLVPVMFHFAGLVSSKIKIGLASRKGSPWLRAKHQAPTVLIHCSSGEFEYAKPVIREIKRRNPQLKVAVSYFSPTYAKNIQNTPDVDFSFPSPWEDGHTLREFFETLRPQALLFSRTDVWPGMAAVAQSMGIRTILFSATLSNQSKRLSNPLSRAIARWTLNFLDAIYCVSQEDADNFAKLGFREKVQVLGDTRFDQVLYRLSHPREEIPDLQISRSRLIVAGSTWAEDERVLIPAAAKLKGRLQWIVAPHEPGQAHLLSLEAQISRAGLKSERWTRQTGAKDWDLLIVDKVGILADLYKFGAFAFVGGSFRRTVHSVMEPLASGCITFVGPFHTNNREALEFKNLQTETAKENPLHVVSDAQELIRLLEARLTQSPQLVSQWQREIRTLVKNKTGASQNLAEIL